MQLHKFAWVHILPESRQIVHSVRVYILQLAKHAQQGRDGKAIGYYEAGDARL